MVAEHAEQVEEQNAFLAKMVKEAAELKTECDLRENEFDHLVAQRKVVAIRFKDLGKLRLPIEKLKYFVTTVDHKPKFAQLEAASMLQLFTAQKSRQMSLFD